MNPNLRRSAMFAAATAVTGEAFGIHVREVESTRREGRVAFHIRPADPEVDLTIAQAGPVAVGVLLDGKEDDSAFGELLRTDGLVGELLRHVARALVREEVLSRDAFLDTIAGSKIALSRIRQCVTRKEPEQCSPA